MPAGNTKAEYGWVSRCLHWGLAALIIVLLGLGQYIEGLTPSLSTLWLFGLHKSLGITALALAVLRIIWHGISPPPPVDATTMPAWQAHLARLVRWLFYALMLLVPLSGWFASGAAGPDVIVFDRLVLPRIAPVSEQAEAAGFLIHGLLTKLLMGLLALHVVAALHHQFVLRDGLLARMFRGG